MADAGSDQTAQVGQLVTFNASGSSDPDGFITTFNWTFGDGGNASGQIVIHTYTATGSFTAVLTVTDDQGATDTDTTTVTVTPASPNAIHVEAIGMSLIKRFGGWRTFATATVEVRDQLGNPVPGVLVSGHWKQATGDSDSGTTGSTGKATLKSDVLRKPPSGTTFVFVVDDLSKVDFTYISSANKETQDSISF